MVLIGLLFDSTRMSTYLLKDNLSCLKRMQDNKGTIPLLHSESVFPLIAWEREKTATRQKFFFLAECEYSNRSHLKDPIE
jgi:hypothetical protein